MPPANPLSDVREYGFVMTNQVGHQARMECLKASVDQRIEEAQQEKGLLIVYTVHLGDVLSVLRDRPTMQHVVITDRGEPAALLEKDRFGDGDETSQASFPKRHPGIAGVEF